MKRTLLALLVCLQAIVNASADTWTDAKGLVWQYTVNNSKATITGLNTARSVVDVPATVNGYEVTCIGDSAFRSMKNIYLYEITIPNSVTRIGVAAFENSNLDIINLPDSMTDIGERAFLGCNISKITIPKGISVVKSGTFCYCRLLKEVSFPESVTCIESAAFRNFKGETINLPKGLISIGANAFGYSSIKNITIPDGVTIIPAGAFTWCEWLESVNLPNGLTEIGRDAFYSCRELKSITIPENVSKIGVAAFAYCPLDTINILATTPPSLGDYSFGYYEKREFHVYKGFAEIYNTSPGWLSNKSNIIDDIDVIPATGITIEKGEYACAVGDTLTPAARVTNDDATIKKIVWSCSDETIISIDKNTGTFVGLRDGVATITATAVDGRGAEATVVVTIGNPAYVSSITLNTVNAEIEEDRTLILNANVSPVNAFNKVLLWKSSDDNVATVKDGIVTAISVGEAIITASSTDGSGIYATATIKVIPAKIKTITFDFSNPESYGYKNPDFYDGSEVEEGSTLVFGEVTISNTKVGSSSTRFWRSGDGNVELRGYKGCVLTVSIAEGCTIKAMKFEGSKINNFSFSVGEYNNPEWKGAAHSIDITHTNTSSIKSLEVTYERAGNTNSINTLDATNTKTGNGKYIENGRIVILKNGKKYNIYGIETNSDR